MARERALRILHVLDHSLPHHSGYSFRTESILRGQRALGWQTFHLTSPKQGGHTFEEESHGLHFFRTPESSLRAPWFAELGLMKKMRQRLIEVAQRVQPDLLQVHSPVLNALPALSAGRLLRVPVVYEVRALWEDAATDHGTTTAGSPRYRVTRWLETLALHRAHHVTVLCQGLAEEIAARGVPKQKITVIPNAVDARVFTPDRAPDPALRSAYGLTGKTVVSFIGSFYAYEGLSLLIQALPKVMAAHPSLALLLVGGGPQEAALKAQVERHHLSDRVVFAGRVSHTRIEEYYALSDLMVYPRLPMRLTELVTPIKPLEAMAQGRVVLASDVGGHKELIDHARTGWLFKAGSVEALADAMIALLKDRTRSPGVLERARRFVADTRTWEHSVARYQPVFEALVGRR